MFFLPGASGAGAFWQPIAERLADAFESVLFDWPGLGDVPAAPAITSFDDLVDLVLARLDQVDAPVDLVAQSMGGVVAVRVALARPDRVRRLVLAATSGGVDLGRFDVEDWRPEYRAAYPHAAAFASDPRQEDLSEQMARIEAPALLLWASGDRISPPAVGRYLASRLARARLVIVDSADHQFARERPAEVAALVRSHLTTGG